MQKILYILRHAKAELGVSYQDDHARTLTERGVEAASVMGQYMLQRGIIFDLVLCSTAQRALKTCEQVRRAYQTPPQVQYSEQLYLASANEILSAVSRTPDNINSILVVGHNPGLHQLCLKLAKQGDEDLIDTMALKFPTCSFAAIALNEKSWSEAAQAHGTLNSFMTPGLLASHAQ